MAGVMLERDGLARQMQAQGMVEAASMERDTSPSSCPTVGSVRPPFTPSGVGLGAKFSLLQYSCLRGRVSKMPTAVIQKMLEGLETGDTEGRGLGMDAAILPCRLGGLASIQTMDTSYPMFEDPWLVGRVACASLVGNLFALGVVHVDSIQMILTLSTKMTEAERDTVMPLIIKGFKEAAKEAGASVSGGGEGLNPWLTVGGVATSVCLPTEYIVPDRAQVGDVLVLTKPLGTMVAINAFNWLTNADRWTKLKVVVSEDEVRKAYSRAVAVMSRLNKQAALLLHKYGAHGSTQLGGYGLLGHASTLARNQRAEVSFVIHNLPVLAKMSAVAKCCGNMFNLLKGEAAEVSGGLLIALPREQAAAFCKDTEKIDGSQSWIIGIVEKGNRTARIIDKPRVIEVPNKEREGELW